MRITSVEIFQRAGSLPQFREFMSGTPPSDPQEINPFLQSAQL
jgi:hypothetical protein